MYLQFYPSSCQVTVRDSTRATTNFQVISNACQSCHGFSFLPDARPRYSDRYISNVVRRALIAFKSQLKGTLISSTE